MKEFNDFLSSVDTERIQKEFKNALNASPEKRLDSFQTSTVVAISMLRQYHEWLNQ